jgi:hypothetical protein
MERSRSSRVLRAAGILLASLALALAAGCGRPPSVEDASADLPASEVRALEALFTCAGVRARDVPLLRARAALDLPADLLWTKGGHVGRDYPSTRDEQAAGVIHPPVHRRPGQPDLRSAVVVEGGHVVAIRLGPSRCMDLGKLGALPELVLADIHDGLVASMATLPPLPRLEMLGLVNNDIREVAGLARLPSLRVLHVAGNRIESLAGLSEAPGLVDLVLGMNRVTSMEGLERLPELRSVSLEGNPIRRLGGLGPLTKLRYLNLAHCAIERIENLDGARGLVVLNLWGNRVRRLENLEGQDELMYLGLGDNPIDWNDPTVVADWERLGRGRFFVWR